MLTVKVSTDVGVEIVGDDPTGLLANQRIGMRDGKRKLITEYTTEIEIPTTIEELCDYIDPTEIRVESGKKITVPECVAKFIDAMILDEHQRVQVANRDGGGIDIDEAKRIVMGHIAKLTIGSPQWADTMNVYGGKAAGVKALALTIRDGVVNK